MKKSFVLLLSLFVSVFAFSQNTVSIDTALKNSIPYLNEKIQANTKVVVLNFVSDWPRLSDYVIEELIGNIVNDGRLTVVDRANLEVLRQEMNFQLSGEVSSESMQTIGQKLGAQFIISGTIIDTGAGIRLRIRVISVESAQIPGMYSANLTQDNRLAFLTRVTAPAQTTPAQTAPARIAPAQTAAASNTGEAPREFFGTWVNSSANAVVTIEANRLTFINRSNNVTYTLENLSWVPYRNGGNMASDYPAGYAITGTVVINKGWSSDTTAANHVSGVGTRYADHWYIHINKRSLNLGQRNTKERYGTASVYNRQ